MSGEFQKRTRHPTAIQKLMPLRIPTDPTSWFAALDPSIRLSVCGDKTGHRMVDSTATDPEDSDETATLRPTGATTGGDGERDRESLVPLIVVDEDGTRTELSVEPGRDLRRVLLEADLSPYTVATRRLNCGGRGLCATCGVRIRDGPKPTHWHDRLAERFGYPRLSCQVTVDEPMVVELVDKRVWGARAE